MMIPRFLVPVDAKTQHAARAQEQFEAGPRREAPPVVGASKQAGLAATHLSEEEMGEVY
jgi:hypothetical protein